MPRPTFAVLALLAAGAALLPPAGAKPPKPDPAAAVLRFGPTLAVAGKVEGDHDVSGAAAVGDFVVIGSDETACVQVLAKTGDGYRVAHTLPLGPAGSEIDIEAVAAEGTMVYVTGSHSRVRHIGHKGGGGVGPVKVDANRDQFFRFPLGPDGKPGPVEKQSLRKTLDASPVLGPFVPVASKENGIDIEGLAVKNGRLFFGFRGPVLRDNWATVLSCSFADPAGTAKPLHLKLGGRGVRDLVSVSDGFLVLAGPVGEGDWAYRLYHWDGTDGLAADDDPTHTTFLADLPDFGKGKPEGLAVLKESGKAVELLLVCDGLKDGGPTRLTLTRH